MARTVPDREAAKAARFNQITVERFVNPMVQALGHSQSRNSRVVQTLCYFSLMRNSGTHTFLNSLVEIEKAARQLFKSPGGNQAAHFLPGQIRIETQFPWHFISDRNTGTRLECLFADVENLPADFNKADSAAEDKGLREAFRTASEVILRDAGPKKPSQVNRNLLMRVYDEIWVPRATSSFFAASTQKEERAAIPQLEYDEQGNITNLEERGEADWSFDTQRGILQHYLDSMRDAPTDLRDDKISAIEREFKP